MSTNRPDAALFSDSPSSYGSEPVEGINCGRIARPQNSKSAPVMFDGSKWYRMVAGEWVEIVFEEKI